MFRRGGYWVMTPYATSFSHLKRWIIRHVCIIRLDGRQLKTRSPELPLVVRYSKFHENLFCRSSYIGLHRDITGDDVIVEDHGQWRHWGEGIMGNQDIASDNCPTSFSINHISIADCRTLKHAPKAASCGMKSILNFMKISLAIVELLHAYRRKNRQSNFNWSLDEMWSRLKYFKTYCYERVAAKWS